MNKRSLYQAVTAVAAGLLLAAAAPLAASAHVTVGPNQAAAGSFTLISFKVPTESATAVTNKIVVTLPQDTPFAYVSYVPVPGWTTELTTEKLATPIKGEDGDITDAVTSVTWTASPGSEIQDGQLQLFPLSVGPVPDTGSIVLAAQQTYSDGTVVEWNGTAEGAEHPAPVLYVNDTPPSDHHSDGATVETAHDATTAPAASDDVLARVLGIGGLVVGIVGLVIGITARRKTAA
ncbi:MAG: YcnI family protein [Rhodoglobus sp.]